MISRKPAKYIDPLTGAPFHDASEFQTIRSSYNKFLQSTPGFCDDPKVQEYIESTRLQYNCTVRANNQLDVYSSRVLLPDANFEIESKSPSPELEIPEITLNDPPPLSSVGKKGQIVLKTIEVPAQTISSPQLLISTPPPPPSNSSKTSVPSQSSLIKPTSNASLIYHHSVGSPMTSSTLSHRKSSVPVGPLIATPVVSILTANSSASGGGTSATIVKTSMLSQHLAAATSSASSSNANQANIFTTQQPQQPARLFQKVVMRSGSGGYINLNAVAAASMAKSNVSSNNLITSLINTQLISTSTNTVSIPSAQLPTAITLDNDKTTEMEITLDRENGANHQPMEIDA